MSTKTELTEAHQAMLALLDTKLANLPEWKAFRAIDKALISLAEAETAGNAHQRPKRNGASKLSYTELTDKALQETGKPIMTNALVTYMRLYRTLGEDLKRATISITSTLSKSTRFRNVAWEGGRAWWYADRPLPKKETAGA
jgi:hypothetical protein